MAARSVDTDGETRGYRTHRHILGPSPTSWPSTTRGMKRLVSHASTAPPICAVMGGFFGAAVTGVRLIGASRSDSVASRQAHPQAAVLGGTCQVGGCVDVSGVGFIEMHPAVWICPPLFWPPGAPPLPSRLGPTSALKGPGPLSKVGVARRALARSTLDQCQSSAAAHMRRYVRASSVRPVRLSGMILPLRAEDRRGEMGPTGFTPTAAEGRPEVAASR